MAALTLPVKAQGGHAWKRMDDQELKSYAESVRNLAISPEAVFGKAIHSEESRLRVRTYARGDQDLLIVESSVPPKEVAKGEMIRSIQLKRLKDDGAVELVWEVIRDQPHQRPAEIRTKRLQKRLVRIPVEKNIEVEPWHQPTDVPANKLFRSISSLEATSPKAIAS